MEMSERWRQHIEAWQASGLSQAAYCRQHRLNANTFSGRLCTYRKASSVAGPELIPVRVETPPATAILVIHLGSGLQLDLPASISPRWLADLLRWLR